MRYLVSNVVLNHKPEERDFGRRYIFRRTKGQGYISVTDSPSTLKNLVDAGYSIIPCYSNSTEDFIIRTIVLDFDNLTKQQYDDIIAYCEANNIPHCDSSGMKTQKRAWQGMPSTFLPVDMRYKHKVFHPVKCPNTYLNVYEAFFKVTRRFNPTLTDELFAKWVRTNNCSLYHTRDRVLRDGTHHKKGERKDKEPSLYIEMDCFKGFALPDVRMLIAIRSQITYGIDPNQPEERKERDLRNIGFAKLLGANYTPICSESIPVEVFHANVPWKNEQALTPNHQASKVKYNETASISDVLENAAMRDYTTYKPVIPLTKSQLAKLTHTNKFNNLVFDMETPQLLGMMAFSNHYQQKSRYDAGTYTKIARFLAYTLTECNNNGAKLTMDDAASDFVFYAKGFFQFNAFDVSLAIDEEVAQRNWDRVKVNLAHTFERYSAIKFDDYRRALIEKQNVLPICLEWVENISNWVTTDNPDFLMKANEARKQYLEDHKDDWKQADCSYTYTPNGARQALIDHMLANLNHIRDLHGDTEAYNRSRISKEEFLAIAEEWMTNDGLAFDESRLDSWYWAYITALKQRLGLGRGVRKTKFVLTGMSIDEARQHLKDKGMKPAAISRMLKRAFPNPVDEI